MDRKPKHLSAPGEAQKDTGGNSPPAAKRKHRGPCPCGSCRAYERCCKPLHEGAVASDAEALMRSRYSAYALALEGYLIDTWHPQTRPAFLALDADRRRWTGLKILHHETTNESAVVEFAARYKSGGRLRDMNEKSRFVREDGQWYYVDGIVSEET